MPRRERVEKFQSRQSGRLSLSRTLTHSSWMRSPAVWRRGLSSALIRKKVCSRNVTVRRFAYVRTVST